MKSFTTSLTNGFDANAFKCHNFRSVPRTAELMPSSDGGDRVVALEHRASVLSCYTGHFIRPRKVRTRICHITFRVQQEHCWIIKAFSFHNRQSFQPDEALSLFGKNHFTTGWRC